MSNKKATEIERTSRQAWTELQRLVATLGHDVCRSPIAQIAKSLGIRRVRFEPLWSNAGLRKVGQEFEVIVNVESPGALREDTIMETDSESSFEMDSSVRFTIAHEIAHMVFLKIAGTHQKDLFVKHHEAIENACNILARVLLLPKQIIVKERGQLLDPAQAYARLGLLGVSSEVFIRRLHLPDLQDELTNLDGLIALVKHQDAALKVQACHVFGAHARERFDAALADTTEQTRSLRHTSLSSDYKQVRWKLESRFLKDLGLGIDIDAILASPGSGETSLNLRWRPEETRTLPCVLGYHCIAQNPLTFLLTIKIIGQLQERGQENLSLS